MDIQLTHRDGRAWLMFETGDEYLTASDLNRTAAFMVDKTLNTTGEPVERMKRYFVPLKDNGEIVLGLAPFLSSIVPMRDQLGECLGERFVIDYQLGMPRAVATALFSSGVLALVSNVFHANGDHVDKTLLFRRDCPEKVLYRSLVHHRRDCRICQARQVNCECNDRARNRYAINYAEDVQGTTVHWEKNVLPLLKRILGTPYTQRYDRYKVHESRYELVGSLPVTCNIDLHYASQEVVAVLKRFMHQYMGSMSPVSEARKLHVPSVPPPPKVVKLIETTPQTTPQTKSEEGKPQVCTKCRSSFSRKCDLTRHIRIVHEGERKHKCNLCGNKFAQQSHVREHIASVHENRKDYKCPECDAAYCLKRKLLRHMREVHQKQRQEAPKKAPALLPPSEETLSAPSDGDSSDPPYRKQAMVFAEVHSPVSQKLYS